MKRAAVYSRGNDVIIHASSQTTEGLWIHSEPYTRQSSDCSNVELGRAVLSALNCSKLFVPHPTQWAGRLNPLLNTAGVKSWSTFAKSAVCVEVEQEGADIGLVPTRNLGAKEGFEVYELQKLSIAIHDGPDRIGTGLREAIALSR